MTVLVLVIALLAVAAYVFRDKLMAFVKHDKPAAPPVSNAVPVQAAPVPVQAPTGAQGPVVVNQDGTRSAPSNPILDAYLHSNPQYVAPTQSTGAPSVDTSGNPLDFAKVGNGVPIPLPKKIVNCPAKVTVRVFSTVNTPSGTDKYSVTINQDSPILVPNAQNEFLSANYAQYAQGIDGPEVSVSSDVPGMAMEIHG